MISDIVGVVAPHTLLVVQDAIKVFTATKTIHAGILMAPDGFYMAERVVIKISQPIEDYFDNSTAPYIEPDYMHKSYGWINYRDKQVHFAVPMNLTGTGTQTTLNAELVYNYIADEWLDLYVRANPARCGLDLVGKDRQRMAYIGDHTGTVHRTGDPNQETDNNNIITHWVKTNDINPDPKDINFKHRLRTIKTKARAQTVGDIEVLIYPDGATSGVTPGQVNIVSMINSGKYYASGKLNTNEIGETFKFRFRSGVSSAELNADMEIYGFTLDTYPERESY
jgi:hypothetical protein